MTESVKRNRARSPIPFDECDAFAFGDIEYRDELVVSHFILRIVVAHNVTLANPRLLPLKVY